MARPAVFVSGVGGKTVRSRRVTEQWNRKRATRKGGGRGGEGGRETENATGTQRTSKAEGRRERRKRETVIFFLRSILRLLFPTNDSVLFATYDTQANDDACARDKRAR